MRLFRPWVFVRWLYSDTLFRIKTTEKILYLTFDDGPDPGSTLKLLDILDLYQIKAQFFCSGKVAKQYPDLIQVIKDRGHLSGNHGFYHLNGWKTPLEKYVSDVSDAAKYTSSDFFRPPYGRLRLRQYRLLKRKYKIVFWDLMPYDFDLSFGREKVLSTLKSKIRPGSIIVLHDTPSSLANEVLTDFLPFALNKRYSFELL
jgi:peptidoglycan-N-acetylglucosamine deacetylase